ncbi:MULTISPECIES: AP2/ERF family transcription factor [Crateriforma]|uniref:AP2 domain protein n=1 Tax=Crateriforma conspicua TaxID=2527996 RepID=A0A5C6FNZ0_9PLAN|nr:MULTISPECIES: AP2/ERF family transcription factor [Crateriforma]TWU64842.1 AP2 domain protein [Crateriforma conspicua]
MRANRNITRIDRKTTGGYLVRVMRRGELTSWYFSDKEYGSKRKALAAAKEYRDELEGGLAGYSAKQLAKKQRSNNTSGVVGVRLVEEKDPRWPSQPTYRYWVAQWSPQKGVRRTKRFSVEKYGEDKAYKMAVQARKKGVAEMEDR